MNPKIRIPVRASINPIRLIINTAMKTEPIALNRGNGRFKGKTKDQKTSATMNNTAIRIIKRALLLRKDTIALKVLLETAKAKMLRSASSIRKTTILIVFDNTEPNIPIEQLRFLKI